MSNNIPPEEPKAPETKFATSSSSEELVATSKVAAVDAWSAFKLIWQDPSNGLQQALFSLGDIRAFNVGIALCALFVVASWMATLKIVDVLIALFSGNLTQIFGGTQLDFSAHFRILLTSSIPVISTIAVLLAIQKIFKTSGNYQKFTFITGIIFAPITFFFFLLWLLGISSGQLIVLVGFFCFTTFILFLNTGLMGVLHLSSRNALLLVPIIVVVDIFIIRIFLEIVY
jgi:hypothetical protein